MSQHEPDPAARPGRVGVGGSDRLMAYFADVLATTSADANDAVSEFDDARAWLADNAGGAMAPLATEAWVFDEALSSVLLVYHRWRGWVPPGGTVEADETPRSGARRELLEETGVSADLLARPSAVAIRTYKPGWSATLGLSYAAIAPAQTILRPEDGQPADWMPLDRNWATFFPDDPKRIRAYAAYLRSDDTMRRGSALRRGAIRDC